jgi:hypothetical protein
MAASQILRGQGGDSRWFPAVRVWVQETRCGPCSFYRQCRKEQLSKLGSGPVKVIALSRNQWLSKGALFLVLPPLLERAFSLAPWILLDLTGLNWRRLEILEKIQDRQTDRQTKLGSGVSGTLLEMPNPHCFFFLS